MVVAKQGRRVLLVEVDLRRPRLGQDLELGDSPGLSVLLASGEGEDGLGRTFALDGLSNLAILQAGPIPPDPVELLDSARMRGLLDAWREQFDLVILDGPPVLPVPDALALAGMADTTIMVARCGLTTRSSLRRAYQLIGEYVDKRYVRVCSMELRLAHMRSQTITGTPRVISLKGGRHEGF